jgi:hypothetical protein
MNISPSSLNRVSEDEITMVEEKFNMMNLYEKLNFLLNNSDLRLKGLKSNTPTITDSTVNKFKYKSKNASPTLAYFYCNTPLCQAKAIVDLKKEDTSF